MRRFYFLALASLVVASASAQSRKATAPVNGPQRTVSIQQPSLQNTPSANLVQKSKNKPTAYAINPAAKSMTLWEQVIGTTTYDNQSNNSNQQRIVVDNNGMAHATWTLSTATNSTTWPDRGTGYNMGQDENWDAEPADRLEDYRCGWPGLMLTGDGGEAYVSHLGVDSIAFAKRSPAGSGAWTISRLPGTVGNDFLWPRAAVDGNTVHVVALSAPSGLSGTPLYGIDGNLVYWRSSDNGATWDIQNQPFAAIDSLNYTNIEADSYAIDARDGKVAVAIFSEDCDTQLMMSADGGSTWNSQIIWDFPIFGYVGDSLSDIDLDGIADTIVTTDGTGALLLDQNGIAHVTFGLFQFLDDVSGDTQYTVFQREELMYWNSNWPTDSLYVLGTPQESASDADDVFTFTIDQVPDYRTSISSMPTMAEGDDGKIYVVYRSADEEYIGTQLFSHLYATVSNDGGDTWAATAELTPDLEFNEYEYAFPSMYKRVSDKLHIVVQRDTEPGLNVRGDLDSWDNNDIVYLAITPDFNIAENVNENISPLTAINLFPNPSTGMIQITGKDLANAPVRVYNAMGQEIVYTRISKNFNAQDRESFDFTYLPAGNYTLSIGTGATRVSKEFVIQH
jgi:Secretion system C-terminal sorting domain